MKTLIVGMGEVGSAHAAVLSKVYEVRGLDLDEKKVPAAFKLTKDFRPEIMHVALRHVPEFQTIVRKYIDRFKPRIVSILSTVPPGTTELFGENAVHSTTRGLHPNLVSGLLNIPKHIGGPLSPAVGDYFSKAGIPCAIHSHSKTTEVAHVLNNTAYGVNLVLADALQAVCRHYGVDYYEAVMAYTMTNNQGFRALGNASKVRPILTPPNGKIGGHCVNMSANLIPEEVRPKIVDLVAKYNG